MAHALGLGQAAASAIEGRQAVRQTTHTNSSLDLVFFLSFHVVPLVSPMRCGKSMMQKRHAPLCKFEYAAAHVSRAFPARKGSATSSHERDTPTPGLAGHARGGASLWPLAKRMLFVNLRLGYPILRKNVYRTSRIGKALFLCFCPTRGRSLSPTKHENSTWGAWHKSVPTRCLSEFATP